MTSLGTDCRRALRRSYRRPFYSAAIILTMAVALGIGVTVFGVVEALILKPLPFGDPERLVVLTEVDRSGFVEGVDVSALTFAKWTSESEAIDELAALRVRTVPNLLTLGPDTIQVALGEATLDALRVLRVQPVCGYWRGDGSQGRQQVFLGHRTWLEHFGGDCSVVGGRVGFEGQTMAVAGVLPAAVELLQPQADLWQILAPDEVSAGAGSGTRALLVVGRLAPGATIERARVELELFSYQLAQAYPATHQDWFGRVEPLRQALLGDTWILLLSLAAVAGCLLLVSFTAIANLTVCHRLERQGDLATCHALGAGRLRIWYEIGLQPSLIALAGGIAGFAVGYALIRILPAMVPIPLLGEASFSGNLLVVGAILLSLACILGVLCPSIVISRRPIADAFREYRRGRRGFAIERSLVVLQVAVTLALVSAAAGFGKIFLNLSRPHFGFQNTDVLAAELRLPVDPLGPDVTLNLQRATTGLLAHLKSSAELTSVALATTPPFQARRHRTTNVVALSLRSDEFDGALRTGSTAVGSARVSINAVSPEYFRTIGARLLDGRDFVEADTLDPNQMEFRGQPIGSGVAIVSESLALRLWDNPRPLGYWLEVAFDLVRARRIVGVTSDVIPLSTSTRNGSSPSLYVPVRQSLPFSLFALARTEPSEVGPTILRQRLGEVEEGWTRVRILRASEEIEMATNRYGIAILSLTAMSAFALLVTWVGVYSLRHLLLIAQWRDLAIRAAHGADGSWLVGRIGREGLALAIAGVTLGVVVLAGVGPALRLVSQDYATDWGAVLAAAALNLFVVVSANRTGAARLSRLNIAEALRRS